MPLPEAGRLEEWYGCMECNLYQQGWFVPHDVAGLIRLLGGRERALADLQDMFEKTRKIIFGMLIIIMPMNRFIIYLSYLIIWMFLG